MGIDDRDPKDRSDETSSNPFVRFKHHVDSNVSFGFNTMVNRERGPSTSLAEQDRLPLDPRGSLDLQSMLFSPYSPAALRHLPQPVPNDLPRHLDGPDFTFEDAFEDLLAVSQGQPLPSIQQKIQQKQLLWQMFPQGEPFWFWHRRLRASGLLGPHPRNRVFHDRPDWDQFHQELDQKAANAWGRSEFGPLDAIRAIGNIWGEVERSVGDLEDYAKHNGLESAQRPAPDTFDELFESIQSAYSSGQRTWDAFMKSLNDGRSDVEKNFSKPRNKVVEDRNEYVDRFGYMHSKVTRKELDAEGNEVSSSTSYQIYPAPEERKSQDHNEFDSEIDSKGSSTKSKNGWFWKSED